MLNGRLTPTQDDYTFVSTCGLSVVDYVLVPHHSVNNCHYFRVDCMSDILTKLNLFDMLSESCKTPDHSMLSFAFTSGNFSQLNQQNEKMNVVNGMGVPNHCKAKKHYNFEQVSEDYMRNETWSNEINDFYVLKLS